MRPRPAASGFGRMPCRGQPCNRIPPVFDSRATPAARPSRAGPSSAPLTLAGALGLSASPAVALVGSGGKTSALADLSRSSVPCIAAATTHMGDWQVGFADRRIAWRDDTLTMPDFAVPAADIVLVTGPLDVDPRRRLRGLRPDQADLLVDWARAHHRPVFIEADGSRQLPLKAPAPHEPPIPAAVDLVVIVAGLTGLGRRLGETSVHRPDRFARLSGCAPGGTITIEHVARVLTHADGGLKNVPRAARRVVLLNQADTIERQEAAAGLASLLRPHVDAIVVAHRQMPDETAPGPRREPRCHVVAVYE